MNLGFCILRSVTGGLFAAHGYPKLFGGEGKQVSPVAQQYLGQGFVQAVQVGPAGFQGMLESMGVPMPGLTARFVGALEFFGGIMLILGILTRPIALLLSGEMAVAIWKVHWKNGLMGQGGTEFAVSMMAACLALFFGRSGKAAGTHRHPSACAKVCGRK